MMSAGSQAAVGDEATILVEHRKIEECKMDCARKFFSKITSDQVKYDIVNSYAKLMELVK